MEPKTNTTMMTISMVDPMITTGKVKNDQEVDEEKLVHYSLYIIIGACIVVVLLVVVLLLFAIVLRSNKKQHQQHDDQTEGEIEVPGRKDSQQGDAYS